MGLARSKYGNKKVKDDGHVFDSMAEHTRYLELKLLKATGQICNLVVHPKYPIEILGQKVCTYIGDFEYLDQRLVKHVEDVKGFETAEFKLKKKLVRIVLNIDIELVRLKNRRPK